MNVINQLAEVFKQAQQSRSCLRGVVLSISLLFAQGVSAAVIDVIYVGEWAATGSGNDVGSGGPGMSPGQKYVVRISYDDTSVITNNVDVLDAFFGPSGNLTSTVDLSAPGNSVDIFVPMEGLDAGSPFIYSQNESNHFPAFIPSPTLNFINNSSISDVANIIGLEFEGDFVAGAGNNLIELFNTSPGGPTVNMQAQILNLGSGIAASGTNTLSSAVDLVVDAGPDIVYNAATLIQTATASITQSNNLGAARSDGEDFVDLTWTPAGTASGNTNQVGISDAGLTTTTDTSVWTVSGTEQMTGKTSSDTLNASYANALPSINATASATASGYDFTLAALDADLAVNTLISGFEMLTFNALVGGVDVSSFFSGLYSGGSASYSNASLQSQFGVGAQNVVFSIADRAGALVDTSVDFIVNQTNTSVPAPPAVWLLLAGLLMLLSRQKLMQK